VKRSNEEIAVDQKPFYVFGRDAELSPDFTISDPAVSRRHAAIVHHDNGRLYVIDLASVCRQYSCVVVYTASRLFFFFSAASSSEK